MNIYVFIHYWHQNRIIVPFAFFTYSFSSPPSFNSLFAFILFTFSPPTVITSDECRQFTMAN